MTQQESLNLLTKQLHSVDHGNRSKTEQLAWEVGFLLAILAEESQHDWILRDTFERRINNVNSR